MTIRSLYSNEYPGDDVCVVLELLGDAAPEDDQEAEYHPGPLAIEVSILKWGKNYQDPKMAF